MCITISGLVKGNLKKIKANIHIIDNSLFAWMPPFLGPLIIVILSVIFGPFLVNRVNNTYFLSLRINEATNGDENAAFDKIIHRLYQGSLDRSSYESGFP
jgi:hypothetical protein